MAMDALMDGWMNQWKGMDGVGWGGMGGQGERGSMGLMD